MNLILFGFKGCGKTHYGKKLAEKMQRSFVDTDNILQEIYAQETGQNVSVREIHRILGEEGFRALEKKAVERLKSLSNAIIALGGGAILDPQNCETLQKIGQLVYLQASMQTLRQRLMRRWMQAEPLSFLKDESEFEALYQMRLPLYESLPAHRIDVDLYDEAAVIAALRNILILEEPILPD